MPKYPEVEQFVEFINNSEFIQLICATVVLLNLIHVVMNRLCCYTESIKEK